LSYRYITAKLGAVHKGRPHSWGRGFIQCGQGGFFRCGRPHCAAKNSWFFKIYGVSARTRWV